MYVCACKTLIILLKYLTKSDPRGVQTFINGAIKCGEIIFQQQNIIHKNYENIPFKTPWHNYGI